MGLFLMPQWYENNRKLFREERMAMASVYPLLRLAVVYPGFKLNSVCFLKQECAVVHGIYSLSIPDSTRQIDYRISILLPSKYPKIPPEMFCNDPKLPIGEIDRHIMKDGRACLGVQADINMRWAAGPTIVEFLENIVEPFLDQTEENRLQRGRQPFLITAHAQCHLQPCLFSKLAGILAHCRPKAQALQVNWPQGEYGATHVVNVGLHHIFQGA